VAISSQVGTFPVTPLPFEEHLRTSDRLKKQAPGKADQGNNGNDTHMAGLLVHWYRNRVVVKVSLAIVCAEAGFSQIRLHMVKQFTVHVVTLCECCISLTGRTIII